MTTIMTSKDVESSLVQEIAEKGDQIPERFILKYPEIIIPAIDAPSNLWENELLIDYSLLFSGHHDELFKLKNAIMNWGCFQVINHGMTNLYLNDLVNVTKQFFSLPLEERFKYSMPDDISIGYATADVAILAGTSKSLDSRPLSWGDRLTLTVYPEDLRKLQLWPENPHRFREILHDFSLRLKMMSEVFLKAMAQSLDLEENSFLKQHGERSLISTRFGLYPRCSCPNRVYGAHPHSDRSTITIIIQDNDVPDGLHIQNGDQWFKVPVIPDALFVNMGDFVEVMSNGVFKSTAHRVVTNSKKERVSVAAFCSPDPEIEVEPIPQLITANKPRLYNKVDLKTHKQLFLETCGHVKGVLDALKFKA